MFNESEVAGVLILAHKGKKEATANGLKHLNLRLRKEEGSVIRFLLPDGVNVAIIHRGLSEANWKDEVALVFEIALEDPLKGLKFKVERCHPSQEISNHGEVYIKYRLSW